MTDSISVFIAEDKDVVRFGLRQMITAMPACEVVGDAVDAYSAYATIKQLKPKVVLLKDEFPDGDGVALAARLKEELPGTGVIVMINHPHDIWNALPARADAYFVREVSLSILEPAIRAVAMGQVYMGAIVSEYLLRGEGHTMLMSLAQRRGTSAALDSLTKREVEVLGLLSEGKTNEQIAQHLELSIQTIKVHVKHILRKLKVSDRTQAVIKALKSGF